MFDKGYKNELFSSLSDSLSHKNPKIPASCVDVYTNLLVNFGLKKMEMLKPVFRELEQYLETTSVILRNAIGNFYKEAFKWLGDGMAAFAGKLKKPLSEELEKFMKGYVRVPIAPLRQSESEPQEAAQTHRN
jgi:hypothetical protein